VERSFITLFLKCILQLLQDTYHNHKSKILEDMSLKIERAMMMMMMMMIMKIAVMLMMSIRKLAAL
jgi:hypothetical protein